VEGSGFEEDVTGSGFWDVAGSGSGFEDDMTGSGFDNDMTGSGFWSMKGSELVINVAGAVLGFKYGDRVEEWVRREQQKMGFTKGSSEMMSDDWERLKKWMGIKVIVRGLKMSEMCRMVCLIGRE